MFFLCNVPVMPHQFVKHKSLFIVLGASNTKDHMKHSFTGVRPCILHILPCVASNRGQLHAHNQASATVWTWLNALWRNSQCSEDFGSMPFAHRSMPVTRPFGKSPLSQTLTVHQQIKSTCVNHPPVHFPTQSADADLCLLKCACQLSTMNVHALNVGSFDKDGHEFILCRNGSSSFGNDEVRRF